MFFAFRQAAAVLIVAMVLPAAAHAQPVASRVLFRVFLSDGRVLSSYGEWARLDDRVIFSMPTQLSREPVELQLVTIPSQRVDWPRTESYAESVRAAAYAAWCTRRMQTTEPQARHRDARAGMRAFRG